MSNLRLIKNDPREWLSLNLKWLRWPFLLLVLVALFVAGSELQGNRAGMLLAFFIAIPILGVGVYAIFRWPALGLVLLMPANMYVPFAIGTGSNTTINITILMILGMTGIWIFGMILSDKPVQLYKSRTFLPLFLMLVAASISFLAGQLPWFTVPGASLPAQIGGLAIFIISVCAFLVAAHQISDIRWLELITWAFVIVGATFVITRLFPQFDRSVGRLFQFGAFSSQFWTWFVAITFSQAWLNKKLNWPWRLALAAVCVGALYVGLVRTFDWRSGWIPPVIAIGVIVAIRAWWVGVLMSVAGIFVIPRIASGLIENDEYSYGTRLDAWIILGDIIKVNPIIGLGPSNYYWYTPLFSIRGYNVQFNSHNQYVDLIAQIGLVGTAFILWFFVEVGLLAWKLLSAVPAGFPRAYVYGAIGGLVATIFSGFLGDWYLPFVYNVGMVGMRSSILAWVFLGALVALQRLYLVDKAPEKKEAQALPAAVSASDIP